MPNSIPYQSPTKWMFLAESRALLGLRLYLSKFPQLVKMPKGDGHPVMVLPGFMGSDLSTLPIRFYLKRLGYKVHTWGLGRNLAKEEYEEPLRENVEKLFQKYNRKVTLIGWSLGGVFGREVARDMPDKIRQVVTMASPFGGIDEVTSVGWIYEFLRRKKIKELDPELVSRLKLPIPVPCTNIYSKGDGIVSWTVCIDKETTDVPSQNIEVRGSHSGLGHHPGVLFCIANRLAQPEGTWKNFDEAEWEQYLKPKTCLL